MSASEALLAGPFAADFFAGAEFDMDELGAAELAGAAIEFEAAGFAAGAGAAMEFAGAAFELAGAEESGAAMLESAFLLFFDFLVEVVSAAIASDFAGVVLVGLTAAELSAAAASAFLDFFDFFLVVVVEVVWSAVEPVWVCAQPIFTRRAKHKNPPQASVACFLKEFSPELVVASFGQALRCLTRAIFTERCSIQGMVFSGRQQIMPASSPLVKSKNQGVEFGRVEGKLKSREACGLAGLLTSSGVDSALADSIGHAVNRQHVGCDAIVDVMGLGVANHVAER